MNKDNAKDYLPLVQALAEGKTIENISVNRETWIAVEEPNFLGEPEDWRIKIEPREWKACVVTQKAQSNGSGFSFKIGELVGYEDGDEDLGYEIIRVREILD